jgi:osmoprotectant transport system substrate-binding protein
MLGHMRIATVPAAVCLATMCLIAACSNSDPLGAETRSMKSIVVGSGDFPESEIVAEIYAQALRANGFDVGRRMGIGSRETYIPALKDHSIDLVPEYIGNLLLYFQPDSTATMLNAVELELYKRLPGDLSILTPSPASDTDTVTVTNGTATVAINDGGGAVTVRTLTDGRVTAANVFSTSPAIWDNHLVALEDPEHNFLAGNIVPLVNSQKKSDHLKDVLDAVSAKLTTPGVAALNAAVAGNSGIDPDQAARNWVRDNGFDHPMKQ